MGQLREGGLPLPRTPGRWPGGSLQPARTKYPLLSSGRSLRATKRRTKSTEHGSVDGNHHPYLGLGGSYPPQVALQNPLRRLQAFHGCIHVNLPQNCQKFVVVSVRGELAGGDGRSLLTLDERE